MREVIQKVIATETEAKQLVQAARSEAEQLVACARSQALEMVEQAHQEAKLEAGKILAVAEAEATSEKAERLARAAAEINASIQLDPTLVEQCVEAALRCVCGAPASGTARLRNDVFQAGPELGAPNSP